MSSEIFTAWITKYALTAGIHKIMAEACDAPGMIMTHRTGGSLYRLLEIFRGEGKEWNRTREAAIIRANDMRAAKIASLRRQIAKLEAMEF